MHSCLGFASRVLLAQVYCRDKPCQYLNCSESWCSSREHHLLPWPCRDSELLEQSVPLGEVSLKDITTNRLLSSPKQAALPEMLHPSLWTMEMSQLQWIKPLSRWVCFFFLMQLSYIQKPQVIRNITVSVKSTLFFRGMKASDTIHK